MNKGTDEDVQHLLQMYESAGGQAPEGDADLQNLFDRISEAKHSIKGADAQHADHETIYPSPEYDESSRVCSCYID